MTEEARKVAEPAKDERTAKVAGTPKTEEPG